MNNYGSTSNILIVGSIIAWGLLYFIGLSIPAHHNSIKLGYDTCFFLLGLGWTLRQKKIQQLFGLFFLIILYNLDLFKADITRISQTSSFYYFATHYSFHIVIIASLLLFPTLFDKYKLTPLTNVANINSSKILFITGTLIIIIQTTVRLVPI